MQSACTSCKKVHQFSSFLAFSFATCNISLVLLSCLLLVPEAVCMAQEGSAIVPMSPFFPGSMVMLRHTQDLQQVQAPAFVGELVILAPTWQHARYGQGLDCCTPSVDM